MLAPYISPKLKNEIPPFLNIKHRKQGKKKKKSLWYHAKNERPNIQQKSRIKSLANEKKFQCVTCISEKGCDI